MIRVSKDAYDTFIKRLRVEGYCNDGKGSDSNRRI
jgi:hypothetical protein